MDVNGQAAIVTGGGSGLGAATAERLARAGARVAVLDVNLDGAAAVAARIGGHAVRCDVSSAEEATAAVAAATEQHGPARILVNCAGIGTAKRILGRDGAMALADFERVIRVNLIGSFNMLRLAAAGMAGLDPLADGERGVIISTASVAAYEGQIGQAAYAASKGGIVSLTLPAARELARHGIRVAAIAPGLFGTPMVEAMTDEVQARVRDIIPFPKRAGRPDEYAQMALAIIANRMVNGAVIRLDAGLRMQAR